MELSFRGLTQLANLQYFNVGNYSAQLEAWHIISNARTTSTPTS